MRALASVVAAAGAVLALRSWRRRRDRDDEWVWQAATAPRDLR